LVRLSAHIYFLHHKFHQLYFKD